MKKQDLKTGMLVETAENNKYIVFKDTDIYWSTYGNGFLIGCNYASWIELNSYYENLKICDRIQKELDIIRVWKADHPYSIKTFFNDEGEPVKSWNLIWEREDQKTVLTLEEIADAFNIDVKKLRIKE